MSSIAPRYPGTWYQATLDHPFQAAALGNKQRADVLVIGAGLAGLQTALSLAESGQNNVVVLETNDIASGASGRNGGFVFGGYSLGEEALVTQLGAQQASVLYGYTQAACQAMRERAAHYAIDCQINPSGVLLANAFKNASRLQAKQAFMREHFDLDWPTVEPDALRQQLRSEVYYGALHQLEAFHFHPLRYCHGLARTAAELGVRFYCQTPVTSLRRSTAGWCAQTPGGVVEAAQVVVAGGGYLRGRLAGLRRAVMPIATYVAVTEPLHEHLDEVMTTRAAVYDNRFAFDYYRPLPDTRLLWGGRIAIGERSPEAVAKRLKADMVRVYPQLRDVAIDYAWSGWMSYAWHEMPQIGQGQPGLWHALAFGGHGMATTSVAGELLADAIANGDDRWQAFRRWGTSSTGGEPGRWLAQLGYWYYQCRDRLAGTTIR
jgi:glycine/D-amino acid oxidase-like deaminating enzyme